jgi:hypothetical protein
MHGKPTKSAFRSGRALRSWSLSTHSGVHFTRSVFAEVDDRAQGVTFVEDVVDDQHITVI